MAVLSGQARRVLRLICLRFPSPKEFRVGITNRAREICAIQQGRRWLKNYIVLMDGCHYPAHEAAGIPAHGLIPSEGEHEQENRAKTPPQDYNCRVCDIFCRCKRQKLPHI
jgi:hypothetical protein